MFWDIHTIYHLVQSSTHFLGGWKLWLEVRLLLLEPRNQTKIIRFYSCIFPFKTHLVADINWKLLSRTYWCGLVAESHLTWAEMVFCFQNCSDLLSEICYSDLEKVLKLEDEGREFVNILVPLFELLPGGFSAIRIQIGKKYWNLETYRKS